mmetsp:Transcript_50090/g.115593  ORF Transcript_50090/g.115593 Transcript_50090/m.115593 type:complete len:210 (-) Transcript_50090:241-870(-)
MARVCEGSTSCSTEATSSSVKSPKRTDDLLTETLCPPASPEAVGQRCGSDENAPVAGGGAGLSGSRLAMALASAVASEAAYSFIRMTASAMSKKSPAPPTTIIVLTPCSTHSGRTRETNGRIGSLSGATSNCIRSSLIIKLVAHVSSSSNSVVAPTSSASEMAAAWEVDPEASAVEKSCVLRPKGRWSMKGEMSHRVTARPSSALILSA